MNIVATVKHVKIYNANYDAASDYLTMQHDEFTNKPILDDHGEMIPRDFYLLEGINCDPYSFNQECQSVNARFGKNQSFGEIKAHHYIVSFDPRDRDENGLTPERAQAIGMELASKAFPGHQCIVCTHPDGHNSSGNIHVHIVINSVRKFDIEQQDFMERPGDSLAGNKHHATDKFMIFFKQATMELCQREHLYQLDLISPARVRITDREYWAQRRGQKALDDKNQRLIDQGITPQKTKYETQLGILRSAIIATSQDSHNFDEFQKKLLENYGIAVHESRGRLTYILPDNNCPIRARKLGTDFEKASLETFFRSTQKREHLSQTHQASRFKPDKASIRLIVDLQNCAKAQSNKYYAQRVKISNLQQMSKTIAFLQENGIGTREELDAIVFSTQADLQSKHDALMATEKRLKTVNLLIRNSGQYLANKKVYSAYLKSKNKKQFRQEHEPEILLYEAARKALNELSGGDKIPSLKQLRAEKEMLTERKNAEYEAFSFVRAKHRELQTVQSNITEILKASPEVVRTSEQEL